MPARAPAPQDPLVGALALAIPGIGPALAVGPDEPVVAVSTVEVYDFVLEIPEANARERGESASLQRRPRARSHNVPNAHAKRRIAA